jgi:hypothetical protein
VGAKPNDLDVFAFHVVYVVDFHVVSPLRSYISVKRSLRVLVLAPTSYPSARADRSRVKLLCYRWKSHPQFLKQLVGPNILGREDE